MSLIQCYFLSDEKKTLEGSCGKRFPSLWLKTWSCSQTGISYVWWSPLTFSSRFKANIHNSVVKVQTQGVGKNEGKIHNIHVLRLRWRLSLIELQRQQKAGVWHASSLLNCSESNLSSVEIQRSSDTQTALIDTDGGMIIHHDKENCQNVKTHVL